ncbi:MAG: CHAP domain-containing protein [Eubacterium sp.]|nr:CHAP domain-containing protein [Eubacterium sp.]
MKFIQKIIVLSIICSLLIVDCASISISAATNPYPATQDVDGDGYYEVPCTRFAWQQVYDNLGVALPSWGNAVNWFQSAKNAGYATGNTPKAGSIAVWSGDYYGHVAYVTSGSGNTFTVNEGGRTDKDTTASHGVVYGYTLTNSVGGKRPYDSGKTLLGFIYPKENGYNPQGHIDLCNGGDGTISVGGWAFDKDAPSTSIDVHVYIGGSAGSNGAEGHVLTANHARDDVNKAYGISGKHGYSSTITTSKRGEQKVYIYAINKGKGSNVLIGSKTVTITAYNPQGTIDYCNGGEGSISTQGWAFDRSDSSKSISVHIYIGGYASDSGAEGHPIVADKVRDDVNKAYGIKGNHGFKNTITTNKRGSQIVTFYAINTGAGGNVFLGSRTVTITEPATQPTTKPIETTPAQTTKTSETTRPVQTTKSNETTRPVQTTKPIETSMQNQTTRPNEPTKPIQPTKQNEPTEKALADKTTNDDVAVTYRNASASGKPARIVIKKLKNKRKRKVIVKWRRRNDVDGYQIKYGYGKKKKTKIVSWIKNSITIKKMKKKKKYTFIIRAFKKINEQIIFGNWSKVRKIRIKK